MFDPKPGDLYVQRWTTGKPRYLYLCCARYKRPDELFFVLLDSEGAPENDLVECTFSDGTAASINEWELHLKHEPVGNLRKVFKDL